jgi:hypothetical protein
MNDPSLVQMKVDLASEQDDVEFELFAVRQGVAPTQQEALQLRSNAVSARIRTVESMLQSRAQKLVVTVPAVATMSKRQINAEFDALMRSLGTL